MRMRRTAKIVLLTVWLAACSGDCPTCNTLRDGPSIVSVQLCGSEVPDPVPGERICTSITDVRYVLVEAQVEEAAGARD